MSAEGTSFNASGPSNLTRQVGGGACSGGSLLKSAARSRSAAIPLVSQRNVTKMMRAAQACGLPSYEIIYEQTGQLRLAVGGAKTVLPDTGDAEPNDFDSEFG